MNSLTILTLVIIAAANVAVGGCIGICGIAGFLLPMLYTGGLGFDVTYALALSFLAFLVSGIIGSFNYYKAGNLECKNVSETWYRQPHRCHCQVYSFSP